MNEQGLSIDHEGKAINPMDGMDIAFQRYNDQGQMIDKHGKVIEHHDYIT